MTRGWSEWGRGRRLLGRFVGVQCPLQFEPDSDWFHAPFIRMDSGFWKGGITLSLDHANSFCTMCWSTRENTECMAGVCVCVLLWHDDLERTWFVIFSCQLWHVTFFPSVESTFRPMSRTNMTVNLMDTLFLLEQRSSLTSRPGPLRLTSVRRTSTPRSRRGWLV